MSSLLASAGDAGATTTTDSSTTTTSTAHWSDSLGLPAGVADDKIRSFKSAGEFVDSYKSAQKLISSKGYARPADDAPADAWDRFYGSIGRPAKAEDYQWQAPEGVSIDDGRLSEVRKGLHAAGLDGRQYKAVMDLYAQESRAQSERATQESERLAAESSAKLKAEWGGAEYGARLAKAKSAAQSLGILDVLDSTGLGDRYEVISAMYRLSERIGEDSAVRGQGGGNVDADIASLNERILKLSPSDPTLPALEKQRGELFARKRGK